MPCPQPAIRLARSRRLELDPIFQGLAVALISGVVVSTALTLLVIPLLYYMYLKTVGLEKVVPQDQ